ncbi:hypothetical protein RIF29_16291 [Crotalaria pallida]|uniref:Reverse transcriptase domain-containing protein n=1 Tax=Crotalaria pallida TaxID=3830 RepID=A0AAN9IDF2_CROPI
MMWNQRARANWLQYGERNTTFFHRKASQRQQRNNIESIMDDMGVVLDDEDNIAHHMGSYFQQLFQTSNPYGIEKVTELLKGRIDESQKALLDMPFTSDEMESTLFQMHPTKAPGKDGTPALFYQRFWHLVGRDVTNLVLRILNEGLNPSFINQTLIVLIPKIKKPLKVANFRPISLCNVIFKIVTKTIANRLKLILLTLVTENQSAFVPNRLITDNALIAFECFHYMKKTKGKKGTMAIKLYMSKAYDGVEWVFLESCLQNLGFSQHWVTLIINCVNTVSFSVMINGEPRHDFRAQRGLRQGDPLSPYLFILCSEVLSAMLTKAVSLKYIHGVKITPKAPIISHLFFADDNIVFSRASKEEAMVICSILHSYETASGQRVNYDKSELSFSRNVPSSRINEVEDLTKIKAVERHTKYLGLPTLIGRSKSYIFDFVKDRVWKKLKGWKEKSLSRAGREVHIKSVAQAIPTYVMGCFALPRSLCKRIDAMIAKFYWGGDTEAKSMHWLNWRKLTVAKKEGGMGFRVIHAFNRAILVKQWWRLMGNTSSLVHRVLKAKYFPNKPLQYFTKNNYSSYTWTSISSARWIIEEGTIWKVGDGTNIDIWEDKWCISLPNGRIHSGQQWRQQIKKVSDLIILETHSWDIGLIYSSFEEFEAKQILKIHLRRRCMEDKLIWRNSQDVEYTIKQGYHLVMARSEEGSSSTSIIAQDFPWSKIWNAHCMPRCRELLWRLCREILPIKANLFKRGIQTDAICPFCGEDEDTINHVFLHCSEVDKVWFGSPLGLRIERVKSQDLITWLGNTIKFGDKDSNGLIFTIIYALWFRRNEWVHKGKRQTWAQVLDRVHGLQVPPATIQDAPSREVAADVQDLEGAMVYFDAALQGEGTGFGMVIIESHGEFMAAATRLSYDSLDAKLAEASAFLWTMELLIDLGLTHVHVKSDCLTLVQAWKSRSSHTKRTYFHELIQEGANMPNHFTVFSFSHVMRKK